MPLSVASSSSSSSSSESELENSDPAGNNHTRSSELIVRYFRQAQSRARTLRGSKHWQKLDNAILDARLALLEVSWSGVLKALKTIEDGLQQLPFGSKLEWRLPILYRLRGDAARQVLAAIPKRRSLSALEAKSLSILKQKLVKERDSSPLSRLDLDGKQAPYNSNLQHGDAVILDSLDLALLVSSSASKSVLTLAYLDLTELPPLLHILPLLEQWYSGFGSPENGTNVFDGLDLRHNHLTGLPDWLPDSIPTLQSLYLSDNPMRFLPPVVTAFGRLDILDWHQPDRLPESNMARLITVARERLEQQTKSFVPSLTMVCTEKLRESQYSPEEINLPHLQRYWDIPRYICAGCKETIYSGDPRFLSTPLRERFTRFDPCVTQLSASGQLPRGTFRRTYIVSSPTWTFCATCLVLHSQDSHLESSEQCQCIACSASRRLWSEKKAIRWAKHHVAS